MGGWVSGEESWRRCDSCVCVGGQVGVMMMMMMMISVISMPSW